MDRVTSRPRAGPFLLSRWRRIACGHPIMKSLALAFVFFCLGITAAAADDSCKAQAVANKFRGDEFKNFMVNCKALMEFACEERAIDQKVSDDAKDSFIKQCIKDAVGSK
jgi:hypothetical protein